MKLICGDCKAILDNWAEMEEHKREDHPVKREALREFKQPETKYIREVNDDKTN